MCVWRGWGWGGGSLAMSGRGKPIAQATLGASYNERHLRRTKRDRGRVKKIHFA